MIELLILFAIIFFVFFLFTAAQLIGFVFAAIGWILSGIFGLLGWILSGSWMLVKVLFVLACFVFFGFFKIIGVAALVLMIVLMIGIARMTFDRKHPAYSRACDEPIDRLRRDINRMRRRMDNLETILGRD